MKAIDKAKLCMKIICERKAIDPVLFEVRKLTSIADYFLIASGSSSRQVQAMASHLLRKMKEAGFRALDWRAKKKVIGYCWTMGILSYTYSISLLENSMT